MITPIISPLESSWNTLLHEEFEKEYFKQLMTFVNEEYQFKTVYPSQDNVFKAFDLCPVEGVKVVLIGQDPYHGPDQAHGLCFSVNDGIPHPPSLKNIFKELNEDLGREVPISGNLSHWASQGVLMLNTILTVRESEAGSHKNKGWEEFTSRVLEEISAKRRGIIFLLWGGHAKKLKSKISKKNEHVILEAGHPSPLSANRGYWFGNRHFSMVNTILKEQGNTSIDW